MSCLAATDVQLVVVNDGRMSSSSAWNNAVQLGLRPMRCLEVEYDYVGKMLAMLILTAKDEQFASLPETRCVACMLLAILEA